MKNWYSNPSTGSSVTSGISVLAAESVERGRTRELCGDLDPQWRKGRVNHLWGEGVAPSCERLGRFRLHSLFGLLNSSG